MRADGEKESPKTDDECPWRERELNLFSASKTWIVESARPIADVDPSRENVSTLSDDEQCMAVNMATLGSFPPMPSFVQNLTSFAAAAPSCRSGFGRGTMPGASARSPSVMRRPQRSGEGSGSAFIGPPPPAAIPSDHALCTSQNAKFQEWGMDTRAYT